MELFNTSFSNPFFIITLILFTITSSITVFDKRMIQAHRSGEMKSNEMLPSWVGIIGWIHWILGAILILINWKYALIIFVGKFVLSVLPVLEILGNFIMSPFKRK